MTKIIRPSIIVLLIVTSCGFADVFKNRSTGETFNGYAIQKVINGKGRVYVKEDGKFDARTIVLSDYDVKYSIKGRRNTVIVVPLNQKEALISQAISNTIAKTITEAANKGPAYIILAIDNPGGRGDYMDTICKAIKATRDCPVIAYITGDKFGGAYGAAAAIALACDSIYISPSASIGSMAPAYASASDSTDDGSDILSPMNLVTYSGYAANLAGDNERPEIMASAIMDRSIEVLEVDQGGTREFINFLDKVPSQNPIKKWTRLINSTDASGSETIKETLLNITAKDAIYCRMADKLAISQADVISDLGASDAKIIKSATANTIRKRFLASKRNISKLMYSIQYRENISTQLESQLAGLAINNNKIDIRLQAPQQQQQQQNNTSNNRQRWKTESRFPNSPRSRRLQRENEKNNRTAQAVQMDPRVIERYRLTMELGQVLNGLIADYQGVIKLGRKYPGAMPADINPEMTENNLTRVRMRLASL